MIVSVWAGVLVGVFVGVGVFIGVDAEVDVGLGVLQLLSGSPHPAVALATTTAMTEYVIIAVQLWRYVDFQRNNSW